MMTNMTKTTKELADRNTVMLLDTEACPSAPLQDNTVAIQERFDAALAALVARIQSEVSDRYYRGFTTLVAPRIEVAKAFGNSALVYASLSTGYTPPLLTNSTTSELPAVP